MTIAFRLTVTAIALGLLAACAPAAAPAPNYWPYEQNFVLQDKMYEPNASWSLPSHLFLVSAWSANCDAAGDTMSCKDAIDGPTLKPGAGLPEATWKNYSLTST